MMVVEEKRAVVEVEENNLKVVKVKSSERL